LFGHPSQQVVRSDEELRKEFQYITRRFSFVAIPQETWASSVAPGAQDISSFASLDLASTSAFAPHDRDTNAKPVIVPPAERAAGTAMLWADTRPEGQVSIQKVDGSTKWQHFLNGYANYVEIQPGNHTLSLVYIRSGDTRYDYSRELPVELEAGKTYIVSFDAEDSPYIEDIGTNAYCEIRKYKEFAAWTYLNSWLACVRR
jgi:hypothetical protein